MEQTIRRALAALNQRNSEPYDGVLGMPPEWMPDPLINEFHQIRNDLLDRFTPDQVRKWLAAYREMMLPIEGFRSVPYFPIKHKRDLESLVYIQDIFSLGEADAIPAYLGEGPHKVYRQAFVAKHDRERREKGVKNSAEARRAKNAARDRRIHDARAEGRTPKQIVADKQIVGDKRLSVSTVNRILGRPRP